MSKVILQTGGNLGNREKLIADANYYIEKQVGRILQMSSIYESEPWGFMHANRFLNQIVTVETNLQANEILNKVLEIESDLGRQRNNAGYEGRTMDIDILFYDDIIIENKTLTIPHPRLHQRKFILMPLNEILPKLIHPLLKKSVSELYSECNDSAMVEIYYLKSR